MGVVEGEEEPTGNLHPIATAVQARDRFSPRYRSLVESGELAGRVEGAPRRLGDCALGPGRPCPPD